ncbi:MAG TPA: hypothetical protein VMK65_12565, partial [Longimicrobiales bacterium]|nr:hypothetical protein [Longimicrobiales bacterium]
AFVLWKQNQEHEIMLLPMTGGQPRMVVKGFGSPEWSPDGRHLYLTRPVDPDAIPRVNELVRVSLDGGDPEPMGIAMDQLSDLAVHAPSNRIAFSAGHRQSELWLMENFLSGVRAATAASGR